MTISKEQAQQIRILADDMVTWGGRMLFEDAPFNVFKRKRDELHSLLQFLEQQDDQDAKDAARYRWLRSDGYAHADDLLPFASRQEMSDWGKWLNRVLDGAELDAAIDAALQSSTGSIANG